LIEAVTYRLSVHTTADDPTKYRSDEEVKEWEKLDPIPRFLNYLLKKKILNEKSAAKVEEEVLAEVAGAVERFEASRDVDPLDSFDHLFVNTPDEIKQQRAEFAECLKREGIGAGH